MRNVTCLAVAGLAVLGAGCADVNGYGSYPGYGYGSGYSGYGGGYSGYGYGGGYAQPAYQTGYYQPQVVSQTRYVSNPNWQNGQSSSWSQWHHHHHDHDGDDDDHH